MLWDLLGDLLEGLFTPGPPSTEKAARVRAVFALVVALALVIAAAALSVAGFLARDSTHRTWELVLAVVCLLYAGLFWYNARRMVLDSRQ